RAVQDANNLGWKLALVLQERARPALLETYELERHFAARENVEIASRSAVFIAPETDGQRRVRDAWLELARKHAWARPMVNVGRLSVASVYGFSPLNLEEGALDAPAAQPGAAAPDGRLKGGHFVDFLGEGFVVAYFGAEGPAVEHAAVIEMPRAGHDAIFARYGVADRATYVFRPDGHVLARCPGIDPAFAHKAIARVLHYLPPKELKEAVSVQPAADRLFDTLSSQLDAMPPEHRAAALAPVIARIVARSGNLEGVSGL
ncbi:MAG: FAD-dependent monooxygenase, partial [Betaproteobacteria bacterium]|nr:FAD-dependent monooxygenase [Betaproteobacteria bacterium]